MVLSYDYAKRKRLRWRTNAPPSQAILMTMRRRWSDKCGIAQCSMPRATLEATGCRHRATTHSISPWRPPGQQQTIQRCNMYPLWWLFQWPSRCGGNIPHASPDGGGRGLSYKPLNTAIGWAHAPIASIGHRNAAIWLDVWGAWCWGWRDMGWQGNIYIGLWHINLTGRTWRMEWNTYIGVLN